jgi:hypothetical protein
LLSVTPQPYGDESIDQTRFLGSRCSGCHVGCPHRRVAVFDEAMPACRRHATVTVTVTVTVS